MSVEPIPVIRRSELFIHINMYLLSFFNQIAQHRMSQLLNQQLRGCCRQHAKSARLGKHTIRHQGMDMRMENPL